MGGRGFWTTLLKKVLLQDAPRTLPLSLAMFAIAALWVALQAIPIIGIFLIFLLAPLWSILFINAGFVGIGAEAIAGRVPRLWLVLPIAWFGGYLLFALHDHRALDELRAEIAAGNAATHIPFDPAAEALVVDSKYDEGHLVDDYALPVLYSEVGNSQGYSHVSYRMIGKETCGAIRDDRSARGAGIDIHLISDRTGDGVAQTRFDERFCNLQQPEDPKLPVVRVERRETATTFRGLPVTLYTATITTPGGRSFTVRNGSASPLSWLPMPVIGCDQWTGTRCEARFQRDSFVALVPGKFRFSEDTTLPRALGLKPVQPMDRHPADAVAAMQRAHTTMQMAERNRQAAMVRELALLDAVIADVSTKTESQPFENLSGQTDLLLPRLPAMVKAIERGFEQPGGWDNAERLLSLVGNLPRSALAPYDSRLEAVRAREQWFEDRQEPLPDQCKTPAQRRMSADALRRDLDERRNRAIDDAALVTAYRNPECYPRDRYGHSILGLHNGATVDMKPRFGHAVIFYTLGVRARYVNGTYVDEPHWDQTCFSVRGIEIEDVGGGTPYCVPIAVARLIAADMARLRH